MNCTHTRDVNSFFSLKSYKIHTTTDITVLPPLFDWKLKLAHFYSRNAKMKLKSAKKYNHLGSYI
jgi:hypothetical protein